MLHYPIVHVVHVGREPQVDEGHAAKLSSKLYSRLSPASSLSTTTNTTRLLSNTAPNSGLMMLAAGRAGGVAEPVECHRVHRTLGNDQLIAVTRR